MSSPIILWVRRDLRLADHPALAEACASGRPVIPVFIKDAIVDATGGAAKWRLGLSVEQFAKTLEAKGSRLILRQGHALEVLRDLIKESGAGAVYWTRLYDGPSIERDTEVKTALKSEGVEAKSFAGHVLFEPWNVETNDGGIYRVYTPFWKNVRNRAVRDPLPAPLHINAPSSWPKSDVLEAWKLGAEMSRGAEIVGRHVCVGEAAAQERLQRFIEERVDSYKLKRDFPAAEATSRLSENLTYGEISPVALWHAGRRAMEEGKAGAEHFLKEVAWREFAYHLIYHTPQIETENWRSQWDSFPWSEAETDAVIAWKQGHTGEAFVDAAMREMYVTGTMHNRARMIVGSYLTKHLMAHWKIGLKWFEECLIDWDPASNAMGWQWVAGSGPDAAPYFRVFNPATQLDKFDGDGRYRRAWIAEGQASPSETALSFFDAAPRRWGLSAEIAYPDRPVVALDEGRKRALAAYENREK